MMDALFIMRLQKDRKLYLCFADLEKTFNRIPRKVVGSLIVKALTSICTGATAKVKASSVKFDKFFVKVAVHQDCIITAFNGNSDGVDGWKKRCVTENNVNR